METTVSLGDRTFTYTPATRFLVEVGRYSKGSYRTRYSFTGDLRQAVRYYSCINIGRGYKKRLVAVAGNTKTRLARAAS